MTVTAIPTPLAIRGAAADLRAYRWEIRPERQAMRRRVAELGEYLRVARSDIGLTADERAYYDGHRDAWLAEREGLLERLRGAS